MPSFQTWVSYQNLSTEQEPCSKMQVYIPPVFLKEFLDIYSNNCIEEREIPIFWVWFGTSSDMIMSWGYPKLYIPSLIR